VCVFVIVFFFALSFISTSDSFVTMSNHRSSVVVVSLVACYSWQRLREAVDGVLMQSGDRVHECGDCKNAIRGTRYMTKEKEVYERGFSLICL
jgi:hypothetical protein